MWVIVLVLTIAADWPQFRGPNASGIAKTEIAPPTEFGPGKHVLWKQPMPPGHSSPVLWGDRIFLTGFDKPNNKVEVLCLSSKDGKTLWKRTLAVPEFEKVQEVSSPVSATPAVDGERVYVYFGSYGLAAFDFEGKQVWEVKMPVAKTRFGSGTSPVVTGELVLLNRDEVSGGYLLAVDRKSGKSVWKQPLSGDISESYSTPVIWRGHAVLHRYGSVDAFDLKDGKRKWWVNAGTSGTSTVTVDNDTVYAATWNPVGESDQFVPLPDFATLLAKYDKNGDGQLSREEFPDDLAVISRPDTPNIPGATMYAKRFFDNLDQNHDGALQKNEWAGFQAGFAMAKREHGLLAIKPSGEGDVTKSVTWKEKIAIPEVPTPLVYDGRVYMVRNGGIVTCLNADTGKLLYRTRLGAGGPYYSSPIVVNGKIYVASGDGTVVVFAGGDELNVLSRNDLGEQIFATPAVGDGVLYVRTAKTMWAFQ